MSKKGNKPIRTKREKIKGRKESGRYLGLPYNLLVSDQYISLTNKARALLIDIAMQFYGYNNGDLSATWDQMKRRGWVSRDTLRKALNELLEKGFIMKTRQGGRNLPTLYAVTYLVIDECDGKLDVRTTVTPPNLWKNP